MMTHFSQARIKRLCSVRTRRSSATRSFWIEVSNKTWIQLTILAHLDTTIICIIIRLQPITSTSMKIETIIKVNSKTKVLEYLINKQGITACLHQKSLPDLEKNQEPTENFSSQLIFHKGLEPKTAVRAFWEEATHCFSRIRSRLDWMNNLKKTFWITHLSDFNKIACQM